MHPWIVKIVKIARINTKRELGCTGTLQQCLREYLGRYVVPCECISRLEFLSLLQFTFKNLFFPLLQRFHAW